uniref:Uncharacterized protein n=1 Tax=Strigamia maritima TaxID=126957 RepID=T1JJN8_STRMM
MAKMERQKSFPDFDEPTERTSKSTLEKFWLLLWKNYKLHTRHKINTLAELFLPVLLSLLLIAVRAATHPVSIDKPTLFRPVDITRFPFHAYSVIKHSKLPVVYSPDVPVVNEVVELVANTFSAQIQKFGFSTENDMEAYIKANSEIDFLAGVVFENMQGNSFPKNVKYKIRLKTKIRANSDNPMVHAEGWLTQQMYPMFPHPGPRSENDYGPSPSIYIAAIIVFKSWNQYCYALLTMENSTYLARELRIIVDLKNL